MGVRAAQHAPDELPGQVEVGAEAGPAGDLVHTIRPDGARADVRVAVRLRLAHGYPSLSVAAASCTALTILSYPVHRQRLPASQ